MKFVIADRIGSLTVTPPKGGMLFATKGVVFELDESDAYTKKLSIAGLIQAANSVPSPKTTPTPTSGGKGAPGAPAAPKGGSKPPQPGKSATLAGDPPKDE